MWAGIAMAAAAIGGALLQSNSASQASKSQEAGTRAGIEAQERATGITRSDQAPAREAGKSSLAAMRLLMGIQPGSQGAVTQNYSGSLVDSTGGKPAPNAELYGTDPAYRKVWDEVQGIHDDWRRSTGAPAGYNSGSDPQWIERAMRERLPATATQQPVETAADGGEFGDSPLMRKFTLEDFENDPVTKASLKFGMDEGEKAIRRMFGASGMSRSGAAVKAASRFATDYGSQKASESYARFEGDKTNIFNRLASVAGLGQTANNVTASGTMNAANNTSAMLTAEGNARGAAAIAQGNAFAGAGNTIANTAMNMYTLDRLTEERQPKPQQQYTMVPALDV